MPHQIGAGPDHRGDGGEAQSSVLGWLAIANSAHHAEPRRGSQETQMPFEDTNRGALFREQKEKETDRDYSGTINIGGVEYWLSGWVKTSKKGAKYLSLAVKPKDAPAADQNKPQSPRHPMDDGPF
jgi:hypothetical protein